MSKIIINGPGKLRYYSFIIPGDPRSFVCGLSRGPAPTEVRYLYIEGLDEQIDQYASPFITVYPRPESGFRVYNVNILEAKQATSMQGENAIIDVTSYQSARVLNVKQQLKKLDAVHATSFVNEKGMVVGGDSPLNCYDVNGVATVYLSPETTGISRNGIMITLAEGEASVFFGRRIKYEIGHPPDRPGVTPITLTRHSEPASDVG